MQDIAEHILKAYFIGRRLTRAGKIESAEVFAKACLEHLAKQYSAATAAAESLLYLAAWTTVMAELSRSRNPLPYRRQLAQLGQQLEKMGLDNPYEIYQDILDATTGKVQAGNFGDFKTQRNARICDTDLRYNVGPFGILTVNCDLAASALGLEGYEHRDLVASLWDTTPAELAQEHGIPCASLNPYLNVMGERYD